MRVSMIGQAAFAEAVLNRLLATDGIEISAVSAPEGGPRPDPLHAAAKAAGIPTIATAALKTGEGFEAWKPLAGDLCVMAFVTDILPEGIFTLPAKGTIQYHPSLLPLHRGMSSINWPIIFGARKTGLTVFWPEKGIDTGPILLQKECGIGPDDTVGSLYFERLFPMGVDAMVEAVQLVAAGKAERVAQDHALATYEPPCGDAHAQIAWHEPADRIYARIRGCNPQPGAWTTVNGEQLRIFDCRLTGDIAPGMPGRVLRVEDEGVDVRLNGGVLRLLRVQPSGQKKIPAAEWARGAGITPGFRFR